MQRAHGTAVIFITHDLRLAAQLCDEVIVMYAGRAVESGPARAVLSTPAHPYTRCLQLANPSLRAERRALYVMPDQMPSLRQLSDMSGLPFRAALSSGDGRVPPRRAAERGHRRRSSCRLHPRRRRRGPSRRRPAIASPPAAAGRPLLQVEALQKHYAAGRGLFAGAAMSRR